MEKKYTTWIVKVFSFLQVLTINLWFLVFSGVRNTQSFLINSILSVGAKRCHFTTLYQSSYIKHPLYIHHTWSYSHRTKLSAALNWFNKNETKQNKILFPYKLYKSLLGSDYLKWYMDVDSTELIVNIRGPNKQSLTLLYSLQFLIYYVKLKAQILDDLLCLNSTVTGTRCQKASCSIPGTCRLVHQNFREHGKEIRVQLLYVWEQTCSVRSCHPSLPSSVLISGFFHSVHVLRLVFAEN